RQKRAEAFGNEAAQRLEQLDEQRRAWYSRLHRYRDFIDETSGTPDADTLHQDYLNAHFSEQERVRVSAALKRLEPQVQPSLTPLAASAEEG
ncbi:MAG: lipase secretion chaperone, partial [Thalassolituus sp.]